MTKARFGEAAGGRVIDQVMGHDILQVDVDSLTISDARKVMHVVLAALESELGSLQEAIKPGDVVTAFKSDVEMTVSRIASATGMAFCQWFEGKILRSGSFHRSGLTKVSHDPQDMG